MTYNVSAYDDERHGAFVRASWCHGARARWELLHRRLRRPDVRCVVASLGEDTGCLLGWAAADVAAGAVIWAYTRDLYGRLRRRGLATSLLWEMDVDVSQPTPMLFWSPTASLIAARDGYRIYYSPGHKPAPEAA